MPESCSIRSTKTAWWTRFARRPSSRARTRRPGRRRPSTTSGGRRLGWRSSSPQPVEVGEPDLDERPDRLLEAGLSRRLERLLVALAGLRGVHALLQPVVPGHEKSLNPLTSVLRTLHKVIVPGHISAETFPLETWKPPPPRL